MPCSDTSSPAVSTSGSTRIPNVFFIVQSAPNEALNVKIPTASRPSACTPSWWKLPVYTSPPVPVARLSASAGTAKIPVASVPQTPARPCTETAPIGSSTRSRSTPSTPSTAIEPATAPITIAAHGATKPARRGDRDERGDHAVQHHREVGLLDHDPRHRDGAERAGGGRDVRRQRDVREVAELVAGDDAERRAGVEAEPPEPEDDHAERDERHVVAGDRVRLAVGAELPDARPEQQRTGERGERALVVHDRRAGEVLHAAREEPAVRVPDPVRDDRVDEREDDAEGEVHPELRALRHRAPDDRERDRGEDDLEEVAGAGGDRGEPAERARRRSRAARRPRGRTRSLRRSRCPRRRTRARSRRGSRRSRRSRARGRSSPRRARRSSSASALPRGTRSRPA